MYVCAYVCVVHKAFKNVRGLLRLNYCLSCMAFALGVYKYFDYKACISLCLMIDSCLEGRRLWFMFAFYTYFNHALFFFNCSSCCRVKSFGNLMIPAKMDQKGYFWEISGETVLGEHQVAQLFT